MSAAQEVVPRGVHLSLTVLVSLPPAVYGRVFAFDRSPSALPAAPAVRALREVPCPLIRSASEPRAVERWRERGTLSFSSKKQDRKSNK